MHVFDLGTAALEMIILEMMSTTIGSVVVEIIVGLNYAKAKKETNTPSAETAS